ncbi:alpha/beta fold hydrolase [Yimella sp. cx-573]|nr:alpha/beta fold hydrolase [Yimella sp. cx-573]
MTRVQFHSRGRTLSVLRVGQGVPVLCLSGLAGVSDDWRPVAHHLETTHTVIAVDLPGCGWAGPGATRVDGLVEADRLADLVAELHLAPVIVVGHSMGGFIAELFARSHPELVSRLVLLDSSVETDPRPSAVRARTETLAAVAARTIAPPARRVSDVVLARRAGTSELPRRAASALGRPETARGLIAWWCSYGSLAAQVDDARRALVQLPPTTVLAATRRRHDTRWIRAQRNLARVLDASFTVLEGSGHRVHLERPDAVAAHIGSR